MKRISLFDAVNAQLFLIFCNLPAVIFLLHREYVLTQLLIHLLDLIFHVEEHLPITQQANDVVYIGYVGSGAKLGQEVVLFLPRWLDQWLDRWLDGSMLTEDVFSLDASIPDSMPVLMLSSMQAQCRLDAGSMQARCRIDAGSMLARCRPRTM